MGPGRAIGPVPRRGIGPVPAEGIGPVPDGGIGPTAGRDGIPPVSGRGIGPASGRPRIPVPPRTPYARVGEASRFLNWLAGQGVSSLGEVGSHHCETYLFHRRHVLDEHGTVVGERSPGTRRRAAQVIIDLLNYGELFTADRPDPSLRPWGGATATAVAEMPSGRGMNKTPPLSDDILRPMLAAALYLTAAVGPHAAILNQQVREADQQWGRSAPGEFARLSRAPVAEITRLLERYQHDGTPLPMLPGYLVSERLAAGWEQGDPLLTVGLNTLARQAGISQFSLQWLTELRGPIEAAVSEVGVQEMFARDAALIGRADGQGQVPWTPPLHRLQAVALVGVARTAAAAVIAAVSGMRACELMELQVGCRLPLEEPLPGLARYRLAGKLVKGQPLGGTRDEWVVIEPAYQAAGLAGQLRDAPADGDLLFGRIAFNIRYKWFRNWVNGPSGQRLGLEPIPDYPVSLRALRRTLAIELAYRPGGVLAAKFQLKHIAAATTEGYASRPGGAQAELLAEVNQHESERNLALLWDEFRNYQNGIMPARPGARDGARREAPEFVVTVADRARRQRDRRVRQHPDGPGDDARVRPPADRRPGGRRAQVQHYRRCQYGNGVQRAREQRLRPIQYGGGLRGALCQHGWREEHRARVRRTQQQHG